jgi:formate/nitrite transporter FocA (FNT family)
MWISIFALAIACAIFLNVAVVMMTVKSAKV